MELQNGIAKTKAYGSNMLLYCISMMGPTATRSHRQALIVHICHCDRLTANRQAYRDHKMKSAVGQAKQHSLQGLGRHAYPARGSRRLVEVTCSGTISPIGRKRKERGGAGRSQLVPVPHYVVYLVKKQCNADLLQQQVDHQ
jgi:hypothetical protein